MSDVNQSTKGELHLLDFVSVQVRDIEASRQFYTDVLGFEVSPDSPPNAVVFQNSAGAIFAIRTPMVDLESVPKLGWGVALWFGVANADTLYNHIVEKGGTIAMPIQNGNR